MRKRVLLVSIIYIIFIGFILANPLFTVGVSAGESPENPKSSENPANLFANSDEIEEQMEQRILEHHRNEGGFVSNYTPSTKQIIIFVM